MFTFIGLLIFHKNIYVFTVLSKKNLKEKKTKIFKLISSPIAQNTENRHENYLLGACFVSGACVGFAAAEGHGQAGGSRDIHQQQICIL